jgi:hypothetical protein
MEPDIQRVRDEIVGRLHTRGIEVRVDEDPEQLVRLLDAVEDFERVVAQKGGDLMVDEPIGARAVREPDNAAFALPIRRADESVAAYTERLRAARAQAARA